MDKDFDVLAVGELNADLILRGDVAPEFGQVEKLIESADLTIGSSTGIFACGAARLGLRVAFIGKVGDDEFGHFLLCELERRGIDISGAVIDPHLKTGLTVILSRGADRAILTFPGCIPALHYEEIDLYGHLAGWSLQRTLRFACICGSLSTHAAGGIGAQPTSEEALNFM